MRPVLPILLALFVIVWTPGASAQSAVPVQGCERECDPREANDGELKRPGDPVDVFLYAHFEDYWGRGVLNTQPPMPEESMPDGIGRNTLPSVETYTGLCVDGTNTCTDLSLGDNRVTLDLISGLVYRDQDGLHALQGGALGYELELTQESPRLYWYMSAQNAAADSAQTKAGIHAPIEIQARLLTGRVEGVTIAESSSSTMLNRAAMVSLPGAATVYEFEIPLHRTGKRSSIPPSEPLRLEVEWSQARIGNLAKVGQQDWRIHGGPEYQPRLVLPVYHPASVVNGTTTHSAGQYLVRWSVQSAFGAYDFQDASVKLETIHAPKGADFRFDHLRILRSVDCHGELDPIRSNWVLDYRNATLPDGTYVVRASILNLQQTYVSSSDFKFKVVDAVPEGLLAFTGSASVPGVGAPSLGLVLGLLAFALARRRAS